MKGKDLLILILCGGHIFLFIFIYVLIGNARNLQQESYHNLNSYYIARDMFNISCHFNLKQTDTFNSLVRVYNLKAEQGHEIATIPPIQTCPELPD